MDKRYMINRHYACYIYFTENHYNIMHLNYIGAVK